MGLSSCTKYGVVRFRAALLGHLSVSSLERCLRSFALDFAAFPLNNGLVVWWLEHSAVTTGSSQEGVTIPPFPHSPPRAFTMLSSRDARLIGAESSIFCTLSHFAPVGVAC